MADEFPFILTFAEKTARRIKTVVAVISRMMIRKRRKVSLFF